jgi:hypothetical protein
MKKKLIAKDIELMNLSELLNTVDSLFPCYKKGRHFTYNYELAKFPTKFGWYFNVISDWHKWLAKKLETHFGGYEKPEYAVRAFIYYVKSKKINVKKLA